MGQKLSETAVQKETSDDLEISRSKEGFIGTKTTFGSRADLFEMKINENWMRKKNGTGYVFWMKYHFEGTTKEQVQVS